MWFVTPFSTPANLEELLESEGATPGGMPAMTMALAELPEAKLASGAELLEVLDPQMASAWGRVACEGSSMPQEFGQYLAAAQASLGFGAPSPLRTFLASFEGEPAATAALVLNAGIAGIYCVATLEAFRGRGLGTAVTVAALAAAREAGYEVGALQASTMGRPVYERIGFREVFRIATYISGPTG